MWRRVLAWGAAALVGVGLGVASAWAALEFGRASFMERYGAWTHSRAAGSVGADPYTRAVIAREGLLALSAREALYFNLAEDSQGRPLSEACVYELSGPPLETRWWSVTLYARDHFLAQNGDHAAAIDATRIRYDGDGRWRARVAPVRGEAAHWLSSRNTHSGFSLTLRVYNPRREFRASAESLPVLTTLNCAGAAP
ncbi:MAG TPA: DUF1214 domain-containing protein [Terricaulis sp.]|nr:DUF1214 domain-containing protein [Terricaulis sp.]HRP09879.1 DUF1214 domain-containing protein [Terricaulis sp.]